MTDKTLTINITHIEATQTIKEITMITYNDKLKECRKAAKSHNLTFTKQPATLNGQQLYMFISRTTGQVKYSGFTLSSAYDYVKNSGL